MLLKNIETGWEITIYYVYTDRVFDHFLLGVSLIMTLSNNLKRLIYESYYRQSSSKYHKIRDFYAMLAYSSTNNFLSPIRFLIG